MVKIKELSNEQIKEQIEKYEKIMLGLIQERDKRVKAGAPKESMMTAHELNEAKKETATPKPMPKPEAKAAPKPEPEPAAEANEGTSPNQFELSDEDLAAISETKEKEAAEAAEAEQAEEEEVRVTEILNLNDIKDQLKK